MPELPEVETVCRGLAPVITNRVISHVVQRRADLRIPFPKDLANRLTNRKICAVRRRAKYILIDLDDQQTLLLHLGMSGRMLIIPRRDHHTVQKHDHLIIDFDDEWRVIFHDPRRFGMVDLFPTSDHDHHPLLHKIGPEPLGNSFHAEGLAAALANRRSPIKTTLLDQQIVAGLGNIYVCEALFHARIDPRRIASSLTRSEIEALIPAIHRVLTDAIAAGGSTLRDYVQASGELGYFQHHFAVYDRENQPCRDCDCGMQQGGIQRIVQSNRSSYFCPARQQ